jgi:hypothetical protein
MEEYGKPDSTFALLQGGMAAEQQEVLASVQAVLSQLVSPEED